MCLVQKELKREISEQPVKCYKMYIKRGSDMIASPFTNKIYNSLKPGDVVVAEGEREINMTPDGCRLGAGFIHAFDCFEMVLDTIGSYVFVKLKDFLFTLNWTKPEDMKWGKEEIRYTYGKVKEGLTIYYLCEMEIPAGEEFYRGEFRDVCAGKMVFVKEMRPKTEEEFVDWFISYLDWYISRMGANVAFESCKIVSENLKRVYNKQGENNICV